MLCVGHCVILWLTKCEMFERSETTFKLISVPFCSLDVRAFQTNFYTYIAVMWIFYIAALDFSFALLVNLLKWLHVTDFSSSTTIGKNDQVNTNYSGCDFLNVNNKGLTHCNFKYSVVKPHGYMSFRDWWIFQW